MSRGFHDSWDGTWRIFTVQRNAEIYTNAVWMLSLRRRAIQGDGTLLNVVSRVRENWAGEWPDTIAELQTLLLAMTNPQLIALRNRIRNLPWLGVFNGQSTEQGPTNAWSPVRTTLNGRFAVKCWEGGGVSEPVWPPPVVP